MNEVQKLNDPAWNNVPNCNLKTQRSQYTAVSQGYKTWAATLRVFEKSGPKNHELTDRRVEGREYESFSNSH